MQRAFHSTLTDILRWRATAQPDKRAYTFLTDGERPTEHCTYAQLDLRARAIAAVLQQQGLAGERALLLYPTGIPFIAAFMGCLYAKTIAIPVPANLADITRRHRSLPRLQAIVDDAQAKAILTTSGLLEEAKCLPVCHWMDTESIPFQYAEDWQPPMLKPDDLIFLQYSSGSTGTPKGVMVSHGNLMHNAAAIQRAFGHSEESIGVSWLPAYHDLGLVADILQPLYAGFLEILMSPFDFIKRPMRWLEAISTYQATTSGAPNFAYALCANRATSSEKATLDLSSWDVAYNCAEPVSAEVMRHFVETFSPCGFNHHAFFPFLGMAEATLMVSTGQKNTLPLYLPISRLALQQGRIATILSDTENTQIVVGCGQSLPDQQILMVDPLTCLPSPENTIGEVWVAGPSVAQGYWNKPTENQEQFQATRADTGAGPFLRTGDLGFLKDNELFITGRLKDLIIIQGQNYYPQDLENTVNGSHPSLRPGCIAAFSITTAEGEQLVVVAEMTEDEVDQEKLISKATAIQGNILEAHRLVAHHVVLLKARTIPKTSSGKIQRSACKAAFLADSLQAVFALSDDERPIGAVKRPPSTPEEMSLCELFAEILGYEQINLDQNFFELGGHSLLATQLAARIRDRFQVELPLRQLFETPTVAALAPNLKNLQGQLLPLLTKVSKAESLYLSYSQERLWFMEQLQPVSALYNIPLAIRLQGKLNTSALENSFRALIARHESLRTHFETSRGQAVSVISEQVSFSLEQHDVSGSPEPEAEAQCLAQAEAGQPFDVGQAPLLRVKLLNLGENLHLLVINLHHLISDGWSQGILLKELAHFYRSFLNGQPSTLPELTIQYTDYAHWQRDWFHGNVFQTQLSYWKAQLQDLPTLLQLPTDRPRPAVESYRGASLQVHYSEDLTERLQHLAQQESVTFFMLVLAAFQVLLFRYSQQTDIAVGIPIANRRIKAIEPLMGFFVNTLVIRGDLDDSPSFRDFLQQIKGRCLDAYAHQDLPFEKLVEELNPERSLSHHPLFQVMFVLQDVSLNHLVLEGLASTPEALAAQVSKFDMLVEWVPQQTGFTVRVEYNSDLFDPATIARFVHHYEVLLHAILANLEKNVAQLPILTDSERQQLLVTWNTTQAGYPQDKGIHQIFAEQVERTPELLAVVSTDQQMTYRELNEKANQLANRLSQYGVLANQLVGICLERDIPLLVGLLAILKLGATYVPLDPNYPEQRMNFILADAQVDWFLTDSASSHRQNNPPMMSTKHIALDTLWPDLEQQKTTFPALPPGTLSHIIYTSGSTGQPKGVEIRHSSTVALCHWATTVYSPKELQGVLASTSICFDLSVFELFVPLIAGGTVLLVQDILHLRDFPDKEKVSLINTVPSAIEQLLKLEAIPASVQTINLAGEPLKNELVKQLYQQTSATKIYDLYGPSEDTTYSTYVLRDPHQPPTIGRPISNTQIYLLDQHDHPVLLGVPGEIHIGGAGLARGYLNRPELTAERFIPNPFGPGRLYKTGDLARYLPDGNIQFLGRRDHQVKLRGFRIELGEIEKTLEAHPAVQEAVVLCRTEQEPPALVAYLVPVTAETAPEIEREQIEQWQSLYQETYTSEHAKTEVGSNFTGWNSSYTGQPIPLEEMQAWRESTVERILALKPTQVYEIGCGTGLLLSRIAPSCASYWASDFSAAVLREVEKLSYGNVKTLERTAEDFDGIAPQSFDTLVLNSVVQYFPSVHYLLEVLKQASQAVSAGGHIFVGDVRDLTLLKDFHSSVVLFKAKGDESPEELEEEIQFNMQREEELCLAPDFFRGLTGMIPNIGEVEILRKQGEYQNELNDFRYDVILHVVQQEAQATLPDSSLYRFANNPLKAKLSARLIPQLKVFLGNKLPDYMLPSHFVLLEQMPLTPNGKIDRKALPSPEKNREQLTSAYIAPGTATESLLCELFAEVLGMKEVGIDDNFFDLGGHSLLATQLVARIRDKLEVEMPLRSLFESPTVAGLAFSIKALRSQILPPVTVRPKEAPLRLSYAQERLWFMEQLEPNSSLYNIPAALRLQGKLNVMALEKSFQALVDRHAVLRTHFVGSAGQATPVIAEYLDFKLNLRDVSHLSNPETEARRLIQEEAHQPFQLNQAPLLRVKLINLAADLHILVINLHHLIADGWSLGILMQELAQAYVRFGNDLPCHLAELPIQYTDYAHWQREWFHGEVLQAQLSYWNNQLAHCPTLLQLPTDRPRPAVESYQGANLQFTYSPELAEGLQHLAQREGVTPFMLLLAAFQALLSRYSQQTDILVGIPIANRRLKAFESLMGLFVNTLVIRGDLEGSPRFRDFLQQLKARCLEAYDHQDLPFEKLVEELNPERSLSHHPLFQVMFALQEISLASLALEGLTTTLEDLGNDTAKFDLSLDLRLSKQGLAGRLEYNRDLFDEATIRRMVGHYQQLLEGIVANSAEQVTLLPLLTTDERQQLLNNWNQTEVKYPKDKCIHHFFEEQAERVPDPIAVVFEDQQLTYAELNGRANQLAHYLISKGVGPEVLVGISLERSLEMLVGVLGILKAGGAYVPLDPTYPRERIAFMLQDTHTALVLVHSATRPLFVGEPIQTICLESQAGEWQSYPTTNPDTPVTLANLISIIYTSGSTGKPKGVMNQHLGVYNHLVYRQSAYQMTEHDRIMQKTSLNFDGSVWELFWPLMVGARVIVAKPAGHKDSYYLCQFIQQHQITMIDFVPAMMHEFLSEPLAAQCHSLRRVFVGGEGLSYSGQQHFFATFNISLTHGYGPTESTVSVIYYECQRNSLLRVVPMGRPIANTQLYILDGHLNPVPIGVAGELHIGGDGLARGYLHRPELTAERFIPNPFGPSRLYKSGDLVRYLADGNVEFLGRVDHQIKLRGFRIELGEIETVLHQHPAIQEVVVQMREDQPGDKRLVAYLVEKRSSENRPRISELKIFLKAQLPEYMVPSVFVFLNKIPVDPNGKIDRKALPVPEATRTQLESAYVAPQTPEELILCQLFGVVLKVDQVGIHDNFFDLGGHSLLATQLVSRIREQLQGELPLRWLFESPTVAALAIRIKDIENQNFPPLRPISRTEPLRLSYAQERLWFMDQLEPNSALYNIPMALSLRGNLNRLALEKSFEALISRHESLRTRFLATNGQTVQVIAEQVDFGLVYLEVSQASEPEAQARVLAQAEAQAAFDLTTGPLLRVQLIKLAEDLHWLVLNLHHIISDGWSWRVMMQELEQAYAGFCRGTAAQLPELPVQYVDYAHWQRAWFQGAVFQTQLDYWKHELYAAPTLLQLPTDRPRPAIESYRGVRLEFAYVQELREQLEALAQREGVTLFMLLLAAFQVLLYRYSQQTDILVGIPIANRRLKEIEPLIGFFVNTLVIRADLADKPTFRDFLQQVKERCLGAYAHQDLPFEKLVEELNPERSLSHHPLFQVMFVLQEVVPEAFALEGLATAAQDLGSRLSRFDLALELIPVPNGLTARVEYSRDLFDDSSIARLMSHYEWLLRAILAHPAESVDRLNILSSAERQQLLVDWNQTQVDVREEPLIHELFEEQVSRTPHHRAVVFGEQALTYQELNGRSNQLAYELRAQGIGPDSLVGLCVERSIDMLVGLWGIIKAGGAYIPLDPTYPRERLVFMAKDAHLALLVTQPALSHLLPELTVPRVYLDAQGQPISNTKMNPLPLGTTPDHLAYVIYTSGSTGQPKGVMVAHRGLVNLVKAQQVSYGLDATSRILQHASLNFDASIFEILLALCVGATLYLGKKEDLLPGPALHRFIHHHQITLMNVPPSVLTLLPLLSQDTSTSLNTLIVAGEACPTSLAEAWSQCCRFFNAYGPTEATVWSTVAAFKPGEDPLTIGRPIANTQIYLLDSVLNPVPIGIAGEIHIGGAGLARGYLNRPELTAERFIPNPFGPGRLYKTGDLARYLPDGNIQFLGRRDHQVKLRGFRIELGEIEKSLEAHPAVQEAVVLCRTEQEPPALVAYLVPVKAETSLEIEREQIEQWQTLYQETYTSEHAKTEVGSNFTGWNSSYTGQPIPPGRDASVARVNSREDLALKPTQVYEIGCGTGLLLSRIAPSCASYWASDFSAAVLAEVAKLSYGNVKTLERTAEDFDGIAPQSVDTLVLNSVVQYFPSVPYLLEVLKQASQAVSAGGHIFVGDVRDLTLLKDFHSSVVLFKAKGDESPEELEEQIQFNLQREEELCLAPDFFRGLTGMIPNIGEVEILRKEGEYQNELNEFRYDVILHVNEGNTQALDSERPLHRFANNPLKAKLSARLIPQLKGFLADKLPDYMIPHHFVLLEQMPLTPNGKIDRKALPSPEKTREQLDSDYVAPGTPTESLLCELFAEVLGMKEVGIHDSFFDLGGHSLLATQLVARIRDRLEVEMPLRSLFESPTVAGLVASMKTSNSPTLMPIAVAPPDSPLKLSYSQEMWWMLFPHRSELEHGVQNTYVGVQLLGDVEQAALENSLKAIIARHESLRTTFSQIERRPKRVIHRTVSFQLAYCDVTGIAELQVIQQLQAEAQAPFDLVTGPLIRGKLYQLGAQNHFLMLSISHLVFDGWSMKIMLKELQVFYLAFTKAQQARGTLPDLTIQYSDYVHWHRKWIKKVLKTQLFYWLKKGRNIPLILDIPTDKPRPKLLSMAGESVSFEVSGSFTQALQELGQREGSTLYMVLLAAFQVLLHQYSGQTDIFVGTPVANRPLKETEELIGLFLNFIVLRGDLSGQPRFCDYLQQVKDTCLGAYAHQDLPFQILVKSFKAFKALTTFRSFKTEKTMRSNVMFNLIDDFGSDFTLGPLQGRFIPLETQHASQTLHLILTRTQKGLTGQLIYSSDLFFRETIVRLTEQYQAVLQKIIANPEWLISPDLF